MSLGTAKGAGSIDLEAFAGFLELANLRYHGEGEVHFFEVAARSGGQGVGALAHGIERGRIECIGVAGGEGGVGVGGVNHLLALLEEERGTKPVPELGEAGETFDFDTKLGFDGNAGFAVGHAVEEPLNELFTLFLGEVEKFGVGAGFAGRIGKGWLLPRSFTWPHLRQDQPLPLQRARGGGGCALVG